jgi:uncharacterized membrane protein YoaK (UPF0700 family)
MFHTEGEQRSDRHNQLLAGYLATVAGLVNSAGFILAGSFSSHVTGNVGRLADNLALGHGSAAALAATMIGAFFLGAFLASMALESNVLRRRPHVYGLLLLGEAALLGGFLVLARMIDVRNPRALDGLALLLCMAMGLQNSLVTRLSGAVVRTTHLTGVVTDLGIEAARWFRFWRAHISRRMQIRLLLGTSPPPVPPHAPKSLLLLTILAGFVLGSAAGAIGAAQLGGGALLVPLALLVSGGVAALVSGWEWVNPEVRK